MQRCVFRPPDSRRRSRRCGGSARWLAKPRTARTLHSSLPTSIRVWRTRASLKSGSATSSRREPAKLSDVLDVEREIARVRGEIEGMEAERRSLDRRVTYATVSVTLTEDRKSEVNLGPVPVSRRLRNARRRGLDECDQQRCGRPALHRRCRPDARPLGDDPGACRRSRSPPPLESWLTTLSHPSHSRTLRTPHPSHPSHPASRSAAWSAASEAACNRPHELLWRHRLSQNAGDLQVTEIFS